MSNFRQRYNELEKQYRDCQKSIFENLRGIASAVSAIQFNCNSKEKKLLRWFVMVKSDLDLARYELKTVDVDVEKRQVTASFRDRSPQLCDMCEAECLSSITEHTKEFPIDQFLQLLEIVSE